MEDTYYYYYYLRAICFNYLPQIDNHARFLMPC